ncbi:MAG: adenylyl-sulfate kinase [Oscillospiraceae bacterium]|nr:adenylyl-sulfate kinase [Oscillospiraceae bacterium]
MIELENMSVVTVGHVDHGKSTVIGRLLADSGSLPEGKLDMVRENCRRNSKPFEYAFLLDALKKEQSQGITIDTARCFFSTEKRRYIIIDTPGHIEFLKNMVTGASRAEAALLVIDAARGIEENTRRHGYFLSMLGIRQVAVLVNKMDLVKYSEKVYNDIRDEYGAFLKKINIVPECFIPVSGFEGDNIANPSKNMPWYKGLTVLRQLDEFKAASPAENLPLRMPVQGVYKFTGGGDSRRIIAGTIESGKLRDGDRLVILPSGKRTSVKSLEVWNAEKPEEFVPGQAAGFTMTEQIFAERGEIVCREDEVAPQVGVKLKVNLFWLGKERFEKGKAYFLKCGTAKVVMRLENVERVVNASDLSCMNRQYVDKHEVAECVLELEHPIAFDLAGQTEATSRFVIIDEYEIAGGGIITEALKSHDYDVRNIRWASGGISGEERKKLSGQGMVVWMTGLSGSGKTTISLEAEKRLIRAGINAYILDGDKLRRGLNSDLGFGDADRKENIRRTAEVAKLFADAGNVTIVTLISPFEESRRQAREIIGDSFMEVYVKADLETCMKRDPKKLYKKAKAGEITSFTGIDSPYEEPKTPDLVLDTQQWDEVECVEMLLGAIASHGEKIKE